MPNLAEVKTTGNLKILAQGDSGGNVMLAFHSDPKIKAKYLARVAEHAALDEIVKGTYFKDGAPGQRQMCAVGCTIHGSDHRAYERELGIPRILARLEDGIFENIPNDLAKTWPHRFLDAIMPGADLSLVWPKFAVWMLTDETYGVMQFAKTDRTQEAIQTVSDMYLFKIEGADISSDDWREVRNAAYAAYAAAAYAAADAAYAADADAAAYAAAYAADAAADAAACAADAGKKTEWRIAQSEKLLEFLRAAK